MINFLKNRRKDFLFFVLFTCLFLGPSLAAAQGLVPCEGTNCTICHLWELADNVINFVLFRIIVPLAAILIAIAGVIYIISAGSDDKVKQAKQIMTNVVIGLFISFAAWLIIDTLIQTLAAGDFSAAWNEFPGCR